MTASAQQWTIRGAARQPIIGDAHLPQGEPRGAVLIAHGFKGYKDYGMFPRIAAELSGRGLIAHRFNFSHSGMTARTETFERPDLFERDTPRPERAVGQQAQIGGQDLSDANPGEVVGQPRLRETSELRQRVHLRGYQQAA